MLIDIVALSFAGRETLNHAAPHLLVITNDNNCTCEISYSPPSPSSSSICIINVVWLLRYPTLSSSWANPAAT